MNEQIGLWVGFVFSLMVFSYILGDNFLYRIAIYAFIGLTAGYLTIVTVESVLLPWVNGTLLAPSAGLGGLILGLVPFVFGLLLLLKTSKRFGRAGNIAIAFIIGTGTAVALVGAISGTLIPLATATGSGIYVDVLNGFLIFIGVSSTLLYFYYLSRRRSDGRVQRRLVLRAISLVGQIFIIITLGAVYAGAILTSLTIFTERMSFILARITGG